MSYLHVSCTGFRHGEAAKALVPQADRLVDGRGQRPARKTHRGSEGRLHRRLAEEKMCELRRLRRELPQSVSARTADVIEAFLAWSRGNLSEDTHRVNRYYCQLFAEHCGQVPARDIKPFHITAWIAEMSSPARVVKEKARRKKRSRKD
jgi:hypothetical protein